MLLDGSKQDRPARESARGRDACRDRAARSGRLSGRPAGRSAIVRDHRPRGARHRTRERLNARLSSNQAEVAQARVLAAADDQAVMHGHTERLGGLDDVSGDGDVRLGRGGIARGVVVHQDQRRGLQLERSLDDLAGIDRRVVDGPADGVGAPDGFFFVAQWLAHALPCRCFASHLAARDARLGASAVRYSFTVGDFHPLLFAGLPAHPQQNLSKFKI